MSRFPRSVVAVAALFCALQLGGCDWLVSADKRIARAEQKIAASDDRGAAIELQNALRSEPENVRARLMLTEVSLRLGDPKAADKELQQAIAHGATAAQTALLQAKTRLALGELNELISQLDAKRIQLDEPDLSTYRGQALLALRRNDEALAAFNQALSVDQKNAVARVGLAEAYLAQGNSDAALSELDKVVTADPQDAAAWLARGTILARHGEYKLAAQALTSARENSAGQLSIGQYNAVLATLTEAQLASGDPEGSRKTHAELAARAPDAPVTRLLAARLAMVEHDYTKAVTEAQKAVAAAPDLQPAKLVLGAALLAQGNVNQAEAQLSRLVQQAPENAEARKLLARANLQLQRPDVAVQLLAPLQQQGSNDPQLDALLGWASLQRGDETAAIELLERSVAAQPANLELKLDLASAYVRAGLNDKAIALLKSLPQGAHDDRRNTLLVTTLAASKGIDSARTEIERIVAAQPRDLNTLNLAAAFYARYGEIARARQLLQQASAIDPKNSLTALNQARVEVTAGNLSGAKAVIEKALQADPKNDAARLAMAEIAVRTGDLAEAVKRLEEIRSSDPTVVQPRLLLARLYLQQQKPREADAVVRETLAQAKGDAVTADAVGRLYLDAGRFDEALNQFRDAARLDAQNPAYLLNIARTQLALGNNSAARETLEKVLVRQPGSVSAAAALAMMDLREGRRDAAMGRVTALKKARPDDAGVLLLEGDVAMATQSYAAAAQAFEAAGRIAPSAAAAVRSYRARQLGKLAEPRAPLEAWLQRRPEDVSVRMVLAESFVAEGRNDQAIAHYQQAVRGERPNAMALNNLAWLYHEKADPRAEETARRAYDSAPQVAAIGDTYGWILVQAGKLPDGLRILEKAVADSKSQPDIRYHYAAALAKSGQQEAARRELRELVRGKTSYPSAADARKLLDELGG